MPFPVCKHLESCISFQPVSRNRILEHHLFGRLHPVLREAFFWMSTKILSVNLYTYISSEISIWCRFLDYLIRARNYFWTSKSETPWGHRPDRGASFWGSCSGACQDIYSKGKNKLLPLSSPLHRKSQNTRWASLDIRYQFPCATWTH